MTRLPVPKRILLVLGTRPEAIKMMPVLRELRARPKTFSVELCLTGQHREIADEVLPLFGVRATHRLTRSSGLDGLSQLSAWLLEELDLLLAQARPDWVLVQGDTTSAAMAALAAFHRRIHVGHVEAGLRSYDLANPFPEEANRKLISVLASLHFAPSPGASDALVREGIDPNSIHMTGNTVIDALRYVSEALGNASNDVFEGVSPDAHVVLVTAHRRENWGEPLRNICRAIRRVALNRLGRTIILFVCHPNPAVRKIVDTELAGVAGVMLSDPLDYLRMVRAIRRSDLVVTDSGGLQEEAPTFGKPVLVIREKTERVEAIAAGTALLIGTQEDRIVCEINRLLDDAGVYEKMARAVNPYGDGQAALRIVDALEQWHATG